jgi:glucose/arabinose dehydrogenase
VTLRDEARVVRIGARGVADVVAPGPDGRVPDVAPGLDAGLRGIALSPNFAADRHVFLYLSTSSDDRVVRYTFTADRLSDPRPILTGIPNAGMHTGGRIRFGPDGMLFIGTGDPSGGPGARDVSALGGKILRTTPTGRIPADNPFPGSATWSYGHRNPQGFDWDSRGRLIASEFGESAHDELNVIRRGGDYGWPEVEGPGDGGGRFVAPVQTWTPGEASPSGITVTSDAVYVAAMRGERLWRVPLEPDGPTGIPEAFLTGELGRLRAVELGPDGTLWVLTNNTSGGSPRAGDDRLVSVPLR